MHIFKQFSRGLGFGALAAIGLTSCQKQGALTPAQAPVPNLVKPALTVGTAPAVDLPVAANGTISGVDVGFMVNTGTWEYNPTKDSWSQVPNMPGGGRYQAAGFVIGKSLIIANLDAIALNWTK